MSTANIEIRPHNVYVGKDQVQIQTIKCVVGTSLGGKYFLFHDSAGAKRYAWFNTGASVDPAPAGSWTGHEVAVLVGDTAGQIATKLAAVLTAVTGFDAAASGATVTLTHTATGYAQPAHDNEASPSTNTGFAFKVTQKGEVEREIGSVKGDIEISGLEQQKVEVTTHATGTTVVKEIVSGYAKPVVSMVFQETDASSLKNLLIDTGMTSFTPVGADQVEVYGYGPNNVGGSNPKVYLRLHPCELDSSDKSQDLNFWTAELQLESLNLSGEAVSELPVTFNIYPDDTKPKSIKFFMIGDADNAGY